ncbi:copper resistance CopC family protein [Mycobacterium sp. SMC-4]|uniref:copper resistance CopC family protein n=1 Tax=Mycobacterium sp. SMC-4 TaxID=2857059 RepID=UPI003D08C1FD
MSAVRFLLGGLLAAVLLIGAGVQAGSVWAHATLIAADPAADSEVAVAPTRVSATFNEEMQAQFAAMTVVGPDGQQWADGDPVVDGAVISVGVRAGAPAGEFTVNYRATSADGHVVSGSWSFRAAGTAIAPAPETSVPEGREPAVEPVTGDGTDGGGMPVWPFVAGAVVLVALGAVWAVRRRR